MILRNHILLIKILFISKIFSETIRRNDLLQKQKQRLDCANDNDCPHPLHRCQPFYTIKSDNDDSIPAISLYESQCICDLTKSNNISANGTIMCGSDGNLYRNPNDLILTDCQEAQYRLNGDGRTYEQINLPIVRIMESKFDFISSSSEKEYDEYLLQQLCFNLISNKPQTKNKESENSIDDHELMELLSDIGNMNKIKNEIFLLDSFESSENISLFCLGNDTNYQLVKNHIINISWSRYDDKMESNYFHEFLHPSTLRLNELKLKKKYLPQLLGIFTCTIHLSLTNGKNKNVEHQFSYWLEATKRFVDPTFENRELHEKIDEEHYLSVFSENGIELYSLKTCQPKMNVMNVQTISAQDSIIELSNEKQTDRSITKSSSSKLCFDSNHRCNWEKTILCHVPVQNDDWKTVIVAFEKNSSVLILIIIERIQFINSHRRHSEKPIKRIKKIIFQQHIKNIFPYNELSDDLFLQFGDDEKNKLIRLKLSFMLDSNFDDDYFTYEDGDNHDSLVSVIDELGKDDYIEKIEMIPNFPSFPLWLLVTNGKSGNKSIIYCPTENKECLSKDLYSSNKICQMNDFHIITPSSENGWKNRYDACFVLVSCVEDGKNSVIRYVADCLTTQPIYLDVIDEAMSIRWTGSVPEPKLFSKKKRRINYGSVFIDDYQDLLITINNEKNVIRVESINPLHVLTKAEMNRWHDKLTLLQKQIYYEEKQTKPSDSLNYNMKNETKYLINSIDENWTNVSLNIFEPLFHIDTNLQVNSLAFLETEGVRHPHLLFSSDNKPDMIEVDIDTEKLKIIHDVTQNETVKQSIISSKIRWLKKTDDGDTSFFAKYVIGLVTRNKIFVMKERNGNGSRMKLKNEWMHTTCHLNLSCHDCGEESRIVHIKKKQTEHSFIRFSKPYGESIQHSDASPVMTTSISRKPTNKSVRANDFEKFKPTTLEINETFPYVTKESYSVTFVGATSSGKSAVIMRYLTNRYFDEYIPHNDDALIRTIPPSRCLGTTFVNNQPCILKIEDTDFDRLCSTRQSLKDILSRSDALAIVFSVCDHSSFTVASKILASVVKIFEEKIHKVLKKHFTDGNRKNNANGMSKDISSSADDDISDSVEDNEVFESESPVNKRKNSYLSMKSQNTHSLPSSTSLSDFPKNSLKKNKNCSKNKKLFTSSISSKTTTPNSSSQNIISDERSDKTRVSKNDNKIKDIALNLITLVGTNLYRVRTVDSNEGVELLNKYSNQISSFLYGMNHNYLKTLSSPLHPKINRTIILNNKQHQDNYYRHRMNYMKLISEGTKPRESSSSKLENSLKKMKNISKHSINTIDSINNDESSTSSDTDFCVADFNTSFGGIRYMEYKANMKPDPSPSNTEKDEKLLGEKDIKNLFDQIVTDLRCSKLIRTKYPFSDLKNCEEQMRNSKNYFDSATSSTNSKEFASIFSRTNKMGNVQKPSLISGNSANSSSNTLNQLHHHRHHKAKLFGPQKHASRPVTNNDEKICKMFGFLPEHYSFDIASGKLGVKDENGEISLLDYSSGDEGDIDCELGDDGLYGKKQVEEIRKQQKIVRKRRKKNNDIEATYYLDGNSAFATDLKTIVHELTQQNPGTNEKWPSITETSENQTIKNLNIFSDESDESLDMKWKNYQRKKLKKSRHKYWENQLKNELHPNSKMKITKLSSSASSPQALTTIKKHQSLCSNKDVNSDSGFRYVSDGCRDRYLQTTGTTTASSSDNSTQIKFIDFQSQSPIEVKSSEEANNRRPINRYQSENRGFTRRSRVVQNDLLSSSSLANAAGGASTLLNTTNFSRKTCHNIIKSNAYDQKTLDAKFIELTQRYYNNNNNNNNNNNINNNRMSSVMKQIDKNLMNTLSDVDKSMPRSKLTINDRPTHPNSDTGMRAQSIVANNRYNRYRIHDRKHFLTDNIHFKDETNDKFLPSLLSPVMWTNAKQQTMRLRQLGKSAPEIPGTVMPPSTGSITISKKNSINTGGDISDYSNSYLQMENYNNKNWKSGKSLKDCCNTSTSQSSLSSPNDEQLKKKTSDSSQRISMKDRFIRLTSKSAIAFPFNKSSQTFSKDNRSQSKLTLNKDEKKISLKIIGQSSTNIRENENSDLYKSTITLPSKTKDSNHQQQKRSNVKRSINFMNNNNKQKTCSTNKSSIAKVTPTTSFRSDNFSILANITPNRQKIVQPKLTSVTDDERLTTKNNKRRQLLNSPKIKRRLRISRMSESSASKTDGGSWNLLTKSFKILKSISDSRESPLITPRRNLADCNIPVTYNPIDTGKSKTFLPHEKNKTEPIKKQEQRHVKRSIGPHLAAVKASFESEKNELQSKDENNYKNHRNKTEENNKSLRDQLPQTTIPFTNRRQSSTGVSITMKNKDDSTCRRHQIKVLKHNEKVPNQNVFMRHRYSTSSVKASSSSSMKIQNQMRYNSGQNLSCSQHEKQTLSNNNIARISSNLLPATTRQATGIVPFRSNSRYRIIDTVPITNNSTFTNVYSSSTIDTSNSRSHLHGGERSSTSATSTSSKKHN
ncbi:hypothetical protein SNEBB_000164 [Seison nebaliae]|nr:hypothetical protein SNEBB_000164 [Seison nebaliae]